MFGFLLEEYGFESLGWEVNGRECSTWFANKPNVTLMFSYEPLSAPTGNVFARLRPDRDEMIHFPVQRLARQKIPGWTHPALENGDTSVESLSKILTVYGDLLRNTFPEVLAARDGIGVRLRQDLTTK